MISFAKHPILWIRKNILGQPVMSPENLVTGVTIEYCNIKPADPTFSEEVVKIINNDIPDYHSLIFSKESLERELVE